MAIRLTRQDKIFIGAIALVHIVFFMLACHYKRIYMGDSFEYIYEALNIKQYFFFYSGNPALPIVPDFMTQRQPGYPFFLLPVYLFTVNNWVVLVLQNLLSVFNIIYCRRALLKVGYKVQYDWLLLLLIIAYPSQFINANTIAPDILLQTFTLFYFGSFINFFQKKELKYAVWMSLALVGGMFVKPVLYPFALAHFCIVVFLAVYYKMKLQRPALVAILPFCAVLMYCYGNYLRTGKFHFTSNQSFNAIFYYYTWYSHKDGIDSADKFLVKERKAINEIPDFKERYDYSNARGMELLEQNFIPYMAFHLKNSARIFIEPGKAEMDLFTGRLTYGRLYHKEQTGFFATWRKGGWGGMKQYIRGNPSLPFVMIVLLFNCIRLIGLLAFFVRRNIPLPLRVFTFILLAYFAVASGPISNTRYFIPVSLIAIGCAVLGFAGWLNKRTETIAGR
jgi:hypothetical protein